MIHNRAIIHKLLNALALVQYVQVVICNRHGD
jgi:hypothetical protein